MPACRLIQGTESPVSHGLQMVDQMRFIVGDQGLSVGEFLDLANRVWPGDYNTDLVRNALKRTINITARDGDYLVGSVRILTDGYFLGTIPELLVDPKYQGLGIGRGLMERAWEASPTSLHFGSQPGKEGFYESLGYERSLQAFGRRKPRIT